MSVLLTGATGFLGCRIMRELLAEDPGRPVVVLGRGPAEELRRRTEAAVRWLDRPALPPGALERVRYVPADLTLPGLGLAGPERDALAREAEQVECVWHCAARLALIGDPAPLFQANVLGTRRVLELAEAAPGAGFVHLSTAFVAGRRRQGRVGEEDLSDEAGFETAYEETKYTAERLVRAWASATGRTATVLRPSLLVTDRGAPEGLPQQPLDHLRRIIGDVIRAKAGRALAADLLLSRAHRRGDGFRLRLTGDPDAALNLVQADYAAHAMVRAVRARSGEPGLRTLHVTHPVNTDLRTAFAAFEAGYPGLALSLERSVPDPTRYEASVQQHGERILRFAMHHRTYDRAQLLRAVGDLPDPRPVDRDYLIRAFGFASGPAAAPDPTEPAVAAEPAAAAGPAVAAGPGRG